MLNKDAPKTKFKRLEVQFTDVVETKDASGNCIIEGYANTSSKDRVGDVVLPAAFEKTLDVYMSNPVLLCNHDWNDPCGVVLESKITDKGLWVKAKISNTREDIKTLVKEGCLRTFSIGYNEVIADYDEATKTKYIKELELLEISIVTVPANAEAMFAVTGTKDDPAAPAGKTEPKAAPVTAVTMKSFIDQVKSVVGNLSVEGVEAVCSYFVESKGEIMTKEQLIAELKKSAPAPAPVSTEAKADEVAPATAPAAGDSMKELLAKIDMIAQGLAKLMEATMPKPEQKPEEEKPAEEEPKDAPAPDAAKMEDEEDSEEDEMSEEEMKNLEAQVEQELKDLEGSED